MDVKRSWSSPPYVLVHSVSGPWAKRGVIKMKDAMKTPRSMRADIRASFLWNVEIPLSSESLISDSGNPVKGTLERT
jgi:hypothetical protein